MMKTIYAISIFLVSLVILFTQTSQSIASALSGLIPNNRSNVDRSGTVVRELKFDHDVSFSIDPFSSSLNIFDQGYHQAFDFGSGLGLMLAAAVVFDQLPDGSWILRAGHSLTYTVTEQHYIIQWRDPRGILCGEWFIDRLTGYMIFHDYKTKPKPGKNTVKVVEKVVQEPVYISEPVKAQYILNAEEAPTITVIVQVDNEVNVSGGGNDSGMFFPWALGVNQENRPATGQYAVEQNRLVVDQAAMEQILTDLTDLSQEDIAELISHNEIFTMADALDIIGDHTDLTGNEIRDQLKVYFDNMGIAQEIPQENKPSSILGLLQLIDDYMNGGGSDVQVTSNVDVDVIVDQVMNGGNINVIVEVVNDINASSDGGNGYFNNLMSQLALHRLLNDRPRKVVNVPSILDFWRLRKIRELLGKIF